MATLDISKSAPKKSNIKALGEQTFLMWTTPSRLVRSPCVTLGTEDPRAQVSRRWPPQLKHKCPLSISPLTTCLNDGSRGRGQCATGPGPAHVAAGGN